MTASEVLVIATHPCVTSGELVRLDELPLRRPSPREWRTLEIRVNDFTDLFGLVPYLKGLGISREIRIEVLASVPNSLLHGPASLVDGRNVLRVEREQSTERTVLRLRLGWTAPLSAILGACLGTATGPLVDQEAGVRVGTSADIPLMVHGLKTSGSVVVDGDEERDAENPGPLPSADVLLHSSERGGAALVDDSVAWSHSAVAEERGWLTRGRGVSPGDSMASGLDTQVFNPAGFRRDPKMGLAKLLPYGADGTVIIDEGGRVVETLPRGYLTRAAIEALRAYQYVIDEQSAHVGPQARARFLLACSLSGIVVHTPLPLDFGTRMLLPEELVRALESDLSWAYDVEAREAREVVVAARVRHAYDALWSRAAADRLPSVSVVMSSMRPEFVGHAIRQVRRQTWERTELVLGLHGYDRSQLDSATLELASDSAVTMVSFDEHAVFGDVMRELSQVASGSVLAKMDDDDWYGANHIRDLVHALDYSRANLVGSGVQYVYMHSADMTLRRNIDQAYRFGGHPGGPTFLLRREDLEAAGGWPRVRRAIDTGLNDAIVNSGGVVYQSGALNFVFNRRSRGHTWKASTEYFIRSARQSWPALRFPPGFGETEDDYLTSGDIARPGAAELGRPVADRYTWRRSVEKSWGLH